MKRTVLAIPDSGPLISLGVADSLDLLLDMPVLDMASASGTFFNDSQ